MRTAVLASGTVAFLLGRFRGFIPTHRTDRFGARGGCSSLRRAANFQSNNTNVRRENGPTALAEAVSFKPSMRRENESIHQTREGICQETFNEGQGHTTRLSPNSRRGILRLHARVGKRYCERLAPRESLAGARASLNWRYEKEANFSVSSLNSSPIRRIVNVLNSGLDL